MLKKILKRLVNAVHIHQIQNYKIYTFDSSVYINIIAIIIANSIEAFVSTLKPDMTEKKVMQYKDSFFYILGSLGLYT